MFSPDASALLCVIPSYTWGYFDVYYGGGAFTIQIENLIPDLPEGTFNPWVVEQEYSSYRANPPDQGAGEKTTDVILGAYWRPNSTLRVVTGQLFYKLKNEFNDSSPGSQVTVTTSNFVTYGSSALGEALVGTGAYRADGSDLTDGSIFGNYAFYYDGDLTNTATVTSDDYLTYKYYSKMTLTVGAISIVVWESLNQRHVSSGSLTISPGGWGPYGEYQGVPVGWWPREDPGLEYFNYTETDTKRTERRDVGLYGLHDGLTGREPAIVVGPSMVQEGDRYFLSNPSFWEITGTTDVRLVDQGTTIARIPNRYYDYFGDPAFAPYLDPINIDERWNPFLRGGLDGFACPDTDCGLYAVNIEHTTGNDIPKKMMLFASGSSVTLPDEFAERDLEVIAMSPPPPES
jgi:hypothetical protein